MVSVLGVCAELERENIYYRLSSGRKLAIEKGVKMGRKVGSVKSMEQKETEYAKVIRSLRLGKSIRDAAAICSVSVSTVQRVKKDFNI
jgi:DNA invertase Pin-like site-specific DNA recombinase